MSDTVVETPAAEAAGPDKRKWAERVLTDILRLMELPARLELKDAAPTPLDKGVPGISVAVLLDESDVQSATGGKRSSLSESLQFLANKIVNRAGTSERRWISVGVGGHPEPKAPAAQKKQPAAPAQPAQGAQAASQAPSSAPPAPAAAAPPQARPERNARGQKGGGSGSQPARVDESRLEVAADPTLSTLAHGLAQRAGTLGRYYAVVGLSLEDRARMLQSCQKSADVTVSVEGEGRARRLVFTPARPLPMPKRAFPDLPDFDEDEEEVEE